MYMYNAGDPGSIPGSGRSPGEGNGNPLQYSCLENSLGRPWDCKELDTNEWLTLSLSLQPSKETGGQISHLPPQRQGAWDSHGIKKQVGLSCGERWLKEGKRWSNPCSAQAYRVTSCLIGFQKRRRSAWIWGWHFGPSIMSKSVYQTPAEAQS